MRLEARQAPKHDPESDATDLMANQEGCRPRGIVQDGTQHLADSARSLGDQRVVLAVLEQQWTPKKTLSRNF